MKSGETRSGAGDGDDVAGGAARRPAADAENATLAAADTAVGRPRTRSAWRRFTAPLAALAGAGCLAGAAAMPWWVRDYRDPLTGPIRATLNGSQLVPALVPLALVVIAGLGAALLTRGVVRRIIGIAVAAAGLASVALALSAVAAPSADRFAAQLTRPAAPVSGAVREVGGPLVAVIGGVLAALAGIVVIVVRSDAGSRGSAYESPAARRERARATGGAGGAGGSAEDPGQLWRALDAGVDPTAADREPDDEHRD